MCPLTHFSFLSLGVSVAASFIFGFIWYGPLFGKTWAGLVGKKFEDCKDKKPEASALLLTIFGTFLSVTVLAYLIHAVKSPCNYGVAFFVWLGFYVPLLLGSVTWEGRPWKLFALNGVYYFLNLQLITLILTNFK